MPSSVRFVLAMLILGALASPVAIWRVYKQDGNQARVTAQAITGGSVARGKAAVARYGCASCHQIEALTGTQGAVGPSLKGVAVRAEIAGVLPNQPDQMVRWLRHPQAVVPGTAYPSRG